MASQSPTVTFPAIPLMRRGWVFALALVLFFTGIAVQTHLHGISAASQIATKAMSNLGDTQGGSDIDHCLLCQDFLAGGGFLPAAAQVLLQRDLLNTQTVIPAREAIKTFRTLGWQGRAPPLR